MIRSKTHQQGFTVIELLISIALFAILVPTIVGFLNTIGALNDLAKDTTIANSVTENKVEALRSAGFLSVDAGTVDFTDELPATLSHPRSAVYTVTVINPSTKQIDIVVSFTGSGGQREATFRTYIGEIGVGQY